MVDAAGVEVRGVEEHLGVVVVASHDHSVAGRGAYRGGVAVEQRGAAAGGGDGAVVVDAQHDPVADGEIAAGPGAEVGAEQAALGERASHGVVEGVNGVVGAGDEHRGQALLVRGEPSLDGVVEHRGSVGGGHDSAVVPVGGDGGGDVAVAQLGERGPFPGVVLAAVHGQLGDGEVRVGGEGGEPAAGGDLRQLVVVADEQQLIAEHAERARAVRDSAANDCLIHGDFQPAHVLVDEGQIRGVIDWADAGTGDPHYDLAVLTVGHTEHLDAVVHGYGGSVDRDRISGYWSWRRLGSIRWMLEHGFDATGDIEGLAF